MQGEFAVINVCLIHAVLARSAIFNTGLWFHMFGIQNGAFRLDVRASYLCLMADVI